MRKIYIFLLLMFLGINLTACSKQVSQLNQPDSAAASTSSESATWNENTDPYYNDYNY